MITKLYNPNLKLPTLMKNLTNKKYSVILFLTGFFGIIISNLASYNYICINGKYLRPIGLIHNSNFSDFESAKGIDLGFYIIGLRSVLIFFVLLIACSVYIFLYKTDEEIDVYFFRIKDKYFTKRKIQKSFSSEKKIAITEKQEQVKPENLEAQIELRKIKMLKSNGLLYGFILLVLEIGLYLILKKYVTEYSMGVIINFSVSIILRFFSAYKCNELSEFNKGSSNMWFLFAIMLPSVALIIAGMNFSIKKEWGNYPYLVSKTSEQKFSYKPIIKYIIYIIIIVLLSVAILYYKNSKSSANQVVDYAPELIDSVNINPDVIDTNTAVSPDTSIVNDINRELLKRKNANLKEDSIVGVKSKEDSIAKVKAIVKLHESLLNFK